MGAIDIDISEYAALGLEGIRAILEDLKDGELSPAEAEDHLLHLVAVVVDELIPTGPFDLLDDEPIEAAVRKGFDLLKGAAKRDAEELTAAADRWAAKIAKALAKGKDRIGWPPVSVERALEKEADLRARIAVLAEAPAEEG